MLDQPDATSAVERDIDPDKREPSNASTAAAQDALAKFLSKSATIRYSIGVIIVVRGLYSRPLSSPALAS